MNIQCENCNTKFNLDETLLKEEGSKVRCSVCKNIFLAYPPEQASFGEEEFVFSDQEKVDDIEAGDLESDFDEILEDPLGEEGKLEEISSEDILDELEGEKMVDISSVEGQGKLDDFSDIDEDTEDLSAPKQSPKRKSRPTFLLIILLLLVAGIFSAGFFAPKLVPDWTSFLKPSEEHGVVDNGSLRISFGAVAGSFVNSEESRNLYVINGTAINNYPKKRRFIRIRASILDDKGREIRTKQVYAGNTFEEEKIKSMSIEEIDEAMENRFGMGRRNFNVAPGGTIPFMIVFGSLPENLGEFTVEAASSSPAK
ncbi:MAG: DUF3426 domain-containing protein [Desulfobacterales bacterium]|nr:DUF3426 domain-containing protein [Desulfobacterales bacterium]